MTQTEARRILSLYRPWSADAHDPEFAGALELARQDAELGRWFEQHCAAQSAIRAGFKQIVPPPGLKEQILSERRAATSRPLWRKPALAMALLVISLLLAGTGVWISQKAGSADELSFASYQNRMVKTALRIYGMDLETNSTAEVRAYLARQNAHADFTLPQPLAEAKTVGCGVLSWQGHRVSMVCFHSGRPLGPGEKTDLFLFVMERAAAQDAPEAASPQFSKVNKMTTASWVEGDLVYLLAAPDDEPFLRKFL